MHYGYVTVAANGRVVIPAEVRESLGMKGGDKLLARVEDGALILEPIHVSIRKAQELVAKYIPPGVSMVDELIAERRAAAEREYGC